MRSGADIRIQRSLSSVTWGRRTKEFNIYDELKQNLTGLGIPEREIAFIHDASTEGRRRKLFREVNQASVRILIGSTQKLGTGVNIQERLIAVHHLDVPWKPSDITQREGRMIRHGNRNGRFTGSVILRRELLTRIPGRSWRISSALSASL